MPRAPSGVEPEIQDMIGLRSRDRDRILAVLRRDKELTPALIPHAIRLLAWDPVVDDVIRALRIVAPKHVGALTDALLDPYEDFAVRRRIPRVMAVCRTQRAVDSLLLGTRRHALRGPLPVWACAESHHGGTSAPAH